MTFLTGYAQHRRVSWERCQSKRNIENHSTEKKIWLRQLCTFLKIPRLPDSQTTKTEWKSALENSEISARKSHFSCVAHLTTVNRRNKWTFVLKECGVCRRRGLHVGGGITDEKSSVAQIKVMSQHKHWWKKHYDCSFLINTLQTTHFFLFKVTRCGYRSLEETFNVTCIQTEEQISTQMSSCSVPHAGELCDEQSLRR